MIKVPYYETSNFVFSNFSAHAVEFEGIVYMTVEHTYHTQKFTREAIRTKITNATSPLAAWKIAREYKSERRTDWEEVMVSVLTNIVRAKVDQHPEVKEALIATGEEEIIEMNDNDEFWSNGADGNGRNEAGKILMKIRGELRG